MLTIIIVIYKTDKKKLQSISDKIDMNTHRNLGVNSLTYNFDGLSMSQNYGLLKGKNNGNGVPIKLALKKVKTEYSIYLDVDIFLEKNFFYKITNIAKKIKDFAILVPNHGNINSKFFFLEKYDGEAAVIFFNMSKLDKIGFFDENYFLYYE
jgi:hypothetical protein